MRSLVYLLPHALVGRVSRKQVCIDFDGDGTVMATQVGLRACAPSHPRTHPFYPACVHAPSVDLRSRVGTLVVAHPAALPSGLQ
jgi:hypothetical protein